MALYNFIFLSNTLNQFSKTMSIHFKEIISGEVPDFIDEMF